MSILKQHQNAVTQLARWKKEELELRDQLIGTLPDSYIPEVGSSKTTNTDNYKVTVKRPLNTTIDSKKVGGVMDSLDGETINNVFNTKYSLNKKGFNLLGDKDRNIVEECLVEKEGQPTISYKVIDDE